VAHCTAAQPIVGSTTDPTLDSRRTVTTIGPQSTILWLPLWLLADDTLEAVHQRADPLTASLRRVNNNRSVHLRSAAQGKSTTGRSYRPRHCANCERAAQRRR
jgi:hypothetical protein